MDELQRDAHKFEREADHLVGQLDHLFFDTDDPHDTAVQLALVQAKRVRTISNLLVRHLAALRDQLQPKEGTSA